MGHKRKAPVTDPVSIRDKAAHEEGILAKYIDHRREKLRRLEERGETVDTDSRILHLMEQIDDAETKRQNAASKVEAMNACIARGDVDPHTDYRDVEEIIADKENQSDSTDASEHATDYDNSDVEGHFDDDLGDDYSQNDSDKSYTTVADSDSSNDNNSEDSAGNDSGDSAASDDNNSEDSAGNDSGDTAASDN